MAGDAAARGMLGLPEDRPLIVTGHAPHVPHPGLLAKYIAARSLADRCGGVLVNLVIDTGTDHLARLDVPVRSKGGLLSAASVAMADERDGVVATRAAAEVRPLAVPAAATPEVRDALTDVWSAWTQAEGSTAAAQAGDMIERLLSPRVGAFRSTYASTLLSTPRGAQLLDAARADPQGCVDAYNAAARASGGRVRVLDPHEMPFWAVNAAGVRRRASDADLGGSDTLMPTALVTTAIVRCSLADVFVHGTGGWAYDRVMEPWVRDWLGWSPAPAVMVTATLPLAGDLADASLRAARQARHDPAGSAGVSEMKRSWLRKIESLPRGGGARREAFRQMHDALKAASNPSMVRGASRAAAAARRRDWPFLFYACEDLDAMEAAVNAAADPRRSTAGGPCPRR
ncbi:MAG: hypothetical protein QF733_07930 [Phycisphaerales bacterium]|nr:hypothetical protein [Phycisphaerales bacterium]